MIKLVGGDDFRVKGNGGDDLIYGGNGFDVYLKGEFCCAKLIWLVMGMN